MQAQAPEPPRAKASRQPPVQVPLPVPVPPPAHGQVPELVRRQEPELVRAPVRGRAPVEQRPQGQTRLRATAPHLRLSEGLAAAERRPQLTPGPRSLVSRSQLRQTRRQVPQAWQVQVRSQSALLQQLKWGSEWWAELPKPRHPRRARVLPRALAADPGAEPVRPPLAAQAPRAVLLSLREQEQLHAREPGPPQAQVQ